jgi:hypothetical protein
MAAYEINPKPEVRCTCGPRLRCTHGQLAPRGPRTAQDPDGNNIPAVTDANSGVGQQQITQEKSHV